MKTDLTVSLRYRLSQKELSDLLKEKNIEFVISLTIIGHTIKHHNHQSFTVCVLVIACDISYITIRDH